MDDKSLKQLWLSAGREQNVEINAEKLIESIGRKIMKMEKSIKRRDALEIFLAIMMTPLFVWWLIVVPLIFVKVGSVLILAGFFLVIFKLIIARRINDKQDSSSEIKYFLLVSLQLVKNQINLLNTTLWWYLLPFFLGIASIFYAYLSSPIIFGIYLLIVAVVYGFIWYGNKKTVKKHLNPLKESLIKALEELSAPE